MDKKALQSYFKSLCDSFYIAYKQVKRLEKQQDELEETEPCSELEIVNKLLEMIDENEHWNKYITQNFSEDGLRKRKDELEQALEEYKNKSNELECKLKKWVVNYKKIAEAIALAITTIEDNDCSIIVTSEKEVIALMNFFSGKGVENHRVINNEEENVKLFPSGNEMCNEFYAAYVLCDDEKMQEVIRTYY